MYPGCLILPPAIPVPEVKASIPPGAMFVQSTQGGGWIYREEDLGSPVKHLGDVATERGVWQQAPHHGAHLSRDYAGSSTQPSGKSSVGELPAGVE